MMRPSLLLLFACASLCAQDVLLLRSGEKRPGRLVGLDENVFRLEVPLPAARGIGTPAPAAPVFATVTIPRADVVAIGFAPDPIRDAIIKSAGPAQLSEVEAIWKRSAPWLSVASSPAARIGCVLGDLLLRVGKPPMAERALEVFSQIETGTWSDEDRMAARQGRLRAMVATGHAKEAAREAGELAATTENPLVLIEAKFLLASAAEGDLRKFLEDNPRWQDDVYAIPRRARLYNEALDHFLFPALFYGSEAEPAARGLWRAAQIYQLCGEPARALESARDVAALYPRSASAGPAAAFIASLPEALRAADPEKEAREGPPAKAETPASASQEKQTKKPPRKKPHEKQTEK